MQILVPPSPMVYLVDVHALNKEAFHSPGEKGSTFKDILESETIPKVFFDVRNDSDALYSHFQVNLHCVIDLQLLEFATRRVHGKFLEGLSKYISEDSGLAFNERLKSKKIKEAGLQMFTPERGCSYDVFHNRPLDPIIFDYCVINVIVMPKLLLVYASKLNHGMVTQIHSTAISRISESQSPYFNGKGMQMAKGPSSIWNRSSNQLPPFPMSIVCETTIGTRCSLDELVCAESIGKISSEKAVIPKPDSLNPIASITSDLQATGIGEPFETLGKARKWSKASDEIYEGLDDDDGDDDYHHFLGNRASPDFTACSSEDCGWCGNCDY